LANLAGVSSLGVGASVIVPLGKKFMQGTLNAAEQQKALDMGKALSNKIPGLTLGERAVPASVYAGLLTNPRPSQQ